ncbi:MAG TPA: hypothetical protein DCX07_14980 [Phycisphaerales bacterium]|nr:hypothetical protein [Phycisphaerales bacterium]
MLRGGKAILATLLAALGAWTAPGAAQTTEPAKTVRAYLLLRDGGQVQGTLLEWDDARFVVQVGRERREIPIEQVKPVSVYVTRRKVMDLSRAETHLALGRYCLENALPDPARREFDEAVRLDASLAKQVEELLASTPASAPGETAAAPPAKGDSAPAPARRKYIPVTEAQIAANHKHVEGMAEKARAFARNLHRVETEHFLIHSTWGPSDDKPLMETCEKMYAALCRQFDIPVKENLWAGKYPIFVFQEPEQFRRWCDEVDKSGLANVAGYCHHRSDGFSYIVMNRSSSKEDFYEVLIHEATHAFMARYVSNVALPRWLNEGLADYMAGELVPGCSAGKRHIRAAKEARKLGGSVARIFQEVQLDVFDYGVAQGLVRLLIARDRAAFVRLVTRLKEGAASEEALKETYKLTHEQLEQLWWRAVRSGS